MALRAEAAKVRRWVITGMHRRPAPVGQRGPIVSFTFDDFPRSALAVGGRILEEHGCRGTYYAAPGLMNTENHLGEQFRREDLDAVQSRGHELASHTFGHISARPIPGKKFAADVTKGREALEALTGRADCGNFAFPFGEVTLAAKHAVGPLVNSARGIWGGLNGPQADLNLLRANSLYGDGGEVERVRKLIAENDRRESWLIFYTHDVRPRPSKFGCTPDLLELAVTLACESRARILTVDEAVSELTTAGRDEAASNAALA